MPKDKNNGREMTPDEKFRSFFSTTAVDIPEEMTRRDENQPEEKPQKRFGLFGRGKEKQETDEAAAEQPQEMPTLPRSIPTSRCAWSTARIPSPVAPSISCHRSARASVA